MKKNVATSLLLLLLFILPNKHESKQNSSISQAYNLYKPANLYAILQLKNIGLNEAVFNYAIEGYLQLLQSGKLKNPDALSIIDFSMPSTAKRLFIVDVANGKLLFNTYVAHGRNSGLQTANSFSNVAESFKSSLGFYTTATTYKGKHGYSL